jgi:hypothetical protein
MFKVFSKLNKKKFNLVIKLLFIGFAISLSTYFVVTKVCDGRFFPDNEDESIFYNSAKLFQETNSFKSPTCNSELRSKIGEFHWYGPAYHLIYGFVAKLFGFNNTYFIKFHFFVFFLSILAIFFIPITFIDKISFLVLYLSSFISIPFIFTYFPETIHVLLSLLLLIIYLKGNENKKYFFLFVLCVLLFSIVRVTLVFWIFALLFNSKFLNSFFIRLLLVLSVFVIVFFYMKYFTAPAHVLGFKEIHSSNALFSISNLVNAVMDNFFRNIKMIYHYLFNHRYGLFSLISFMFLIIASLDAFLKERNKQDREKIFGILLFTFLTLMTFILLYTADIFFLEKQIAFLVPALIYIVIKYNKNVSLILLLFVFIFFPFSFAKTKKNIEQRRESYNLVSNFKLEVSNFREFVKHINTKHSEVNVLYLYNEYDLPNNLITCFLPLSKNGVPILYTQNIIDLNKPDSLKFQVHNKIRIDYVISKNKLDFEWLTPEYFNGYIYLYSKKTN